MDALLECAPDATPDAPAGSSHAPRATNGLKSGMERHPFRKNRGGTAAHQVIVLQSPPGATPLTPMNANQLFGEGASTAKASSFRRLLAFFLLVAHYRVTGLPPLGKKKSKDGDSAAGASSAGDDPNTRDCFVLDLDNGIAHTVAQSGIEEENGSPRVVQSSYPGIAVKTEMLLSMTGVPCGYRVWFEVYDEGVCFNTAVVKMITRIRRKKLVLPTECKILLGLVDKITSVNAFLELCRNYLCEAGSIERVTQAIETSADIGSQSNPAAPTNLFGFASAAAHNPNVCEMQRDIFQYVGDDHPADFPEGMRFAAIPYLTHAFHASALEPVSVQAMRVPFSIFGDRLLKIYAVMRGREGVFRVECSQDVHDMVRASIGSRVFSDDEIMRFNTCGVDERGKATMLSTRTFMEGLHDFVCAERMRRVDPAQYRRAMRSLRDGTRMILDDLMKNFSALRDSLTKVELIALQHLATTSEAFRWAFGPKFAADLSPTSNMMVFLRAAVRKHGKVVVGPNELSVLAHLLSATILQVLPHDENLGFNLLQADGAGKGKNFAQELATKLLLSGAVLVIQNFTNKGMFGEGFGMFGTIICVSEGNAELFLPERAGSPLAEILNALKTLLADGKANTLMMNITDDGRRVQMFVEFDMRTTMWVACNGAVPQNSSAFLSRFTRVAFSQRFQKVDTVDDHKNALADGSDKVGLENFLRHMHDVHAHEVALGWLIRAGRVRPVNRDIMSIVMPELNAALAEHGFAPLERRFRDQISNVATAVCVRTSVMLLLDPEFWGDGTARPARPPFEQHPHLFYECLEQMMYLMPEHVVFALTMLSETMVRSDKSTVLAAIGAFIKKNHAMCKPRYVSDGGVTKEDLRYDTLPYGDAASFADQLRAFMDETAEFEHTTHLSVHKIREALQTMEGETQKFEGVAFRDKDAPEGLAGESTTTLCSVIMFGANQTSRVVAPSVAVLRQAIQRGGRGDPIAWLCDFLTRLFSRQGTIPRRIATAFSIEDASLPGMQRHFRFIEVTPNPAVKTVFTGRGVDDEDVEYVVPRIVEGDLAQSIHQAHAENIGVEVDWGLFPLFAAKHMRYKYSDYLSGAKIDEIDMQATQRQIQHIMGASLPAGRIAEIRRLAPEFMYTAAPTPPAEANLLAGAQAARTSLPTFAMRTKRQRLLQDVQQNLDHGGD